MNNALSIFALLPSVLDIYILYIFIKTLFHVLFLFSKEANLFLVPLTNLLYARYLKQLKRLKHTVTEERIIIIKLEQFSILVDVQKYIYIWK